ncbi:superoxide dismutase [Cu-Zn] precursor [alpha proteobacterium U9-1i]|nr:superoxide dismutase [Cu-Zn] precursor [alpha proteobacterium U9-1i]
MLRTGFSALASLLALAACASDPDLPAFTPQPPKTAWIVAADGRPIGQAQFLEAPRGVMIRLEFQAGALPPGWHGLHLHNVGNCSDFAEGFRASGDHLGHGERVQHGLMNPAGPDAGDLPNLFSAPAGPFAAEFYSDAITLTSADGRANLLDGDGTALVIHASADDQTSQPIGGAGARIACAAVTNLP